MRQNTERTLTLWSEAVRSLDTETYRTLDATLRRFARHDDDYSDALPHAAIAVARGVDMRAACAVALRSAERDRHRASKRAESLDALTDDNGAVMGAPVPTAHARAPFVSWEDVRDALPDRGRAMLDAVATDVLDNDRRTGRARREAPSALYGDDGARENVNGGGERAVSVLMGAGAYASLDSRRPLRPTVLATAVGAPRPRKRAQSDALRREACESWALASVLMHGARESVAERAERAFKFVTRAERSTGARSAIPWMTDLQKASMRKSANRNGMTLAALCGTADVFTAPGEVGASGPVSSLRYRPVTRTDWARAPRVTDAVLAGVAYGAGGAVGLPDREGLNGERVDGETVLTARGARALARSEARDALARSASDVVRVADVYRWTRTGAVLNAWRTAPGRADGERVAGVTLPGRYVPVTVSREQLDATVIRSTRALVACGAPVESADRTTARCSCGSKRGALVRDVNADGAPWAHRPRRNG